MNWLALAGWGRGKDPAPLMHPKKSRGDSSSLVDVLNMDELIQTVPP